MFSKILFELIADVEKGLLKSENMMKFSPAFSFLDFEKPHNRDGFCDTTAGSCVIAVEIGRDCLSDSLCKSHDILGGVDLVHLRYTSVSRGIDNENIFEHICSHLSRF